MPGKLIEDLKYQQAYKSVTITSTETKYNGTAANATGAYIDTIGYGELNIVINAGNFAGDGTLDVTVVHYDTDASGSATLITGCTFTQITSANDNAIHTAAVTLDRAKRYVWVKSVKGGTGQCEFGITAVLGKGITHPESNSPVFDVDPNS